MQVSIIKGSVMFYFEAHVHVASVAITYRLTTCGNKLP
jgi:hypothetical protein